MSMSQSGPAVSDTVYEVQGIFPSDASLQDAMARLTLAGFDRADFSLPITTPAPHEATPEQGAANPTTDTDGRQMRTMHTSMAASVGALAAAGATIATGGAAALALGAAVVAGAGAGALANAASTAAGKMQHDERAQAAANGTLVLSVRAPDLARQDQAVSLMRASGASKVAPVIRIDSRIAVA